MIILIASMGKNNEIGKNNELIWNLKHDKKEYAQKTNGNIVVMGRNTFNSLTEILPNRKHIVLSKTKKFNKELNADVTSVDNVMELIKKCRTLSQKKDVYVIGGESMFNLFIDYAQKMYITKIDKTDNEADAFFPEINPQDWEEKVIDNNKEKDIKYSFLEYDRK